MAFSTHSHPAASKKAGDVEVKLRQSRSWLEHVQLSGCIVLFSGLRVVGIRFRDLELRGSIVGLVVGNGFEVGL